MSDPQSDCELLLGAVMPFAEQMLTEHGEFFPFAASMSPSGECTMVAIMDDDLGDDPEPSELIARFVEHLQASANSGEFKATAIVYDALTIPPEKTQKQDTVICDLDHRDGFSAKVCFPYSIDEGTLEIEEPFASEGENSIFGASS